MAVGFILLMPVRYKAYGVPAMLCDEIKSPPLRKYAPVEITLSAAGDCTMGYDEEFGYLNSYIDIIDRNGDDYPYKNVLDIFKSDDITVVNLETTLTNAVKKAEKEFRFKGKPEYAGILKNSSIACVNIANNHIHDYLDKGYKDTIDNLTKSGTGYFGDGHIYIKEVKGIKVGFIGFKCWDDNKGIRQLIKEEIENLKKQSEIAVVSFHWGIERDNIPCSTQTNLGRFAIDCGADLVIGHHPHVIQSIEEYKGRHIVYSLGNFSYGGHKNPQDKDTFIFIEKFSVENSNVTICDTKVIPCSISSTHAFNDYQPTPLEGEEAKRVIERLKTYSSKMQYGYDFNAQKTDTAGKEDVKMYSF